jgi:hypothetical protein
MSTLDELRKMFIIQTSGGELLADVEVGPDELPQYPFTGLLVRSVGNGWVIVDDGDSYIVSVDDKAYEMGDPNAMINDALSDLGITTKNGKAPYASSGRDVARGSWVCKIPKSKNPAKSGPKRAQKS